MRVLLTGGSGDLATVLTPALLQRGDTPLRLDIVPPRDSRGGAHCREDFLWLLLRCFREARRLVASGLGHVPAADAAADAR
jgi:nucleoside-diphosphate-sugar epimerase